MKIGPVEIVKAKESAQQRQQLGKLNSQLGAVRDEIRKLKIRSYDAAATTRHNANHWQYADNRDANSLIFQDLATLRNRCRYECRNNSYAAGIVDTLANDIIGTGPTPQLESDNPNINETEDKFIEWMADCNIEGGCLADMLRIVGGWQQCESGEGLLSFVNTKKISPREIAMRLLAIEPDRLFTPYNLLGANVLDNKVGEGIKFDDEGRPEIYYISKTHPGAMWKIANITEYDEVPARQIIHLFKKTRPGQSRGVPWLTPSLTLFAELRRFTSATIAAAESAANQAGILKTKVDTTDDDATYAGGEELEIPKNSWLTMPEDSDLQQMRAEHPATTYEMFKNQIINEIARCLNMPFNVAAGNSSNYNYASGRLDWQTYFRAILVIRRWLEGAALGRIFLAWYHEALMVPGYLKYATKDPVNITWHWPGSKHVDPIKEANAQKIRLGSLTTTLANEFAEQGMDWERELKQIAKEKALMKKLGLTMADIAKNQETKEEDDEDDDKKTKGRK